MVLKDGDFFGGSSSPAGTQVRDREQDRGPTGRGRSAVRQNPGDRSRPAGRPAQFLRVDEFPGRGGQRSERGARQPSRDPRYEPRREPRPQSGNQANGPERRPPSRTRSSGVGRQAPGPAAPRSRRTERGQSRREPSSRRSAASGLADTRQIQLHEKGLNWLKQRGANVLAAATPDSFKPQIFYLDDDGAFVRRPLTQDERRERRLQERRGHYVRYPDADRGVDGLRGGILQKYRENYQRTVRKAVHVSAAAFIALGAAGGASLVQDIQEGRQQQRVATAQEAEQRAVLAQALEQKWSSLSDGERQQSMEENQRYLGEMAQLLTDLRSGENRHGFVYSGTSVDRDTGLDEFRYDKLGLPEQRGGAVEPEQYSYYSYIFSVDGEGELVSVTVNMAGEWDPEGWRALGKEPPFDRIRSIGITQDGAYVSASGVLQRFSATPIGDEYSGQNVRVYSPAAAARVLSDARELSAEALAAQGYDHNGVPFTTSLPDPEPGFDLDASQKGVLGAAGLGLGVWGAQRGIRNIRTRRAARGPEQRVSSSEKNSRRRRSGHRRGRTRVRPA